MKMNIALECPQLLNICRFFALSFFSFPFKLEKKSEKIFFFFKNLINLKIINSFFILIIIIFFSNNIKAQEQSEFNLTRDGENYLAYGLDKIANTAIFKLNGLYSAELFGARFAIFNQYKGTSFISAVANFRDDENLAVKMSYPVSNLFSVYSLSALNLSLDSRSIGLNKLERLNTSLGLRLDLNKSDFLQFSAGMEKNTQLDIISNGSLFKLDGELNNYRINDYMFSSKLNGEYLGLNYNRNNYNLDLFAKVFKDFDKDNRIAFNLQYKMLNRAYISPINTISYEMPLIENRLENRLEANLQFDFALTDYLQSELRLSSNNILVARDYSYSLENESQTKVARDLQDLQLGFYFLTKFRFHSFFQNIGISFNSRNEANSIEKKFEISKTDEDLVRSLENQRDNSSNRTRLFSNLSYTPTPKDTVSSGINISLYQYDTPSNLNYDDRDEFNLIFNLTYAHRFNQSFSSRIAFETQHNHLVFLKKQRSGQNNWNRIIRLAPSFFWQTEKFVLVPQFEILANYTAYDYEDKKSQVKSFSFRQIGYKDTIFIHLTKSYSLQFSNIYKYSERGILNWADFSESPQNGISEIFIKALLYYNLSEKLALASGLRYYSIVQKSLSKHSSTFAFGTYSQRSFGPEALIHYKFKDSGAAYISGWLEYQSINNSAARIVPSLYLFTMLNL